MSQHQEGLRSPVFKFNHRYTSVSSNRDFTSEQRRTGRHAIVVAHPFFHPQRPRTHYFSAADSKPVTAIGAIFLLWSRRIGEESDLFLLYQVTPNEVCASKQWGRGLASIAARLNMLSGNMRLNGNHAEYDFQ